MANTIINVIFTVGARVSSGTKAASKKKNKENFLLVYRVRGTLSTLKEENSKCHGFYDHWHSGARIARRQSRFEHSPVTINLVHAGGSILTPMLNTIIDICVTALPSPTRCTDAGVAAGISQHTASSIGTRLQTEDKAVWYICHETGGVLLHVTTWSNVIPCADISEHSGQKYTRYFTIGP